MKQIMLDFLGFTLCLAIPDGSDKWLWRSEFDDTKSRFCQTDLLSLRIVESRQGWIGIELIVFVFAVLLKWDRRVRVDTEVEQ